MGKIERKKRKFLKEKCVSLQPKQQKKTTMKRISLIMLVAAVVGLTVTSCRKEPHDAYLESSGTRVKEVTIKGSDWVTDDPTVKYAYKNVDWEVLTDHVVYDGNVNVYVYENGHQCPLPYVYPMGFVTYTDGTTDFLVENLRFNVETGRVTIIMQDMDESVPNLGYNTPEMTFRIVATAPINYIIQQ